MRKILYTDNPETKERIKAEGDRLASLVILAASVACLLAILAAIVGSV